MAEYVERDVKVIMSNQVTAVAYARGHESKPFVAVARENSMNSQDVE